MEWEHCTDPAGSRTPPPPPGVSNLSYLHVPASCTLHTLYTSTIGFIYAVLSFPPSHRGRRASGMEIRHDMTMSGPVGARQAGVLLPWSWLTAAHLCWDHRNATAGDRRCDRSDAAGPMHIHGSPRSGACAGSRGVSAGLITNLFGAGGCIRVSCREHCICQLNTRCCRAVDVLHVLLFDIEGAHVCLTCQFTTCTRNPPHHAMTPKKQARR